MSGFSWPNDGGNQGSERASTPIVPPERITRARSNGFSENIIVPTQEYMTRLNDILQAAGTGIQWPVAIHPESDQARAEHERQMLMGFIRVLQSRVNQGNMCGFEANPLVKRRHDRDDRGSYRAKRSKLY